METISSGAERWGTGRWGNTHPGLLEEGLAGSLAGGISSLTQVLHVDKGGGGEHDGLIEEQAGLAVEAVTAVDDAEELMDVHERHVGVDILDVCLQEGVLEGDGGQSQGSLDVKVADILGGNLGRQGTDKGWQLGAEVRVLEGVEELGGAVVGAKEGGLAHGGDRGGGPLLAGVLLLLLLLLLRLSRGAVGGSSGLEGAVARSLVYSVDVVSRR